MDVFENILLAARLKPDFHLQLFFSLTLVEYPDPIGINFCSIPHPEAGIFDVSRCRDQFDGWPAIADIGEVGCSIDVKPDQAMNFLSSNKGCMQVGIQSLSFGICQVTERFVGACAARQTRRLAVVVKQIQVMKWLSAKVVQQQFFGGLDGCCGAN